jgi:hypothetical protein
MTALRITVGSESSGRVLIPVVDGVKARLTEIKENRFNAERLDFAFTLMDFDYEDGDDEDNEIIQKLSNDAYVHYETVNLPTDGGRLGKRTKFYMLLKGMSGGKDIDEDTEIDLEEYEGKDYLIDFEHVEKKGGPPNFDIVPGVYKSQVAKIRPLKKKKASGTPVQKSIVVEDNNIRLSDDDDDLYTETI